MPFLLLLILFSLNISRRLEQISTAENGLKTFVSKLMSTLCLSAFQRKSLQTQRFRQSALIFITQM